MLCLKKTIKIQKIIIVRTQTRDYVEMGIKWVNQK